MATLVRWSPWGELTSLHAQMDQLFQHVVGEPRTADERDDYLTLPIDVRQTDGAYVFEASVPGFKPEEVEVTVDSGVLTIKGERTGAREAEEGSYIRRERRSASVLRQVSLPGEVDADGISAQFSNGVLTVSVPRIPKAQPRRIAIEAGNAAPAGSAAN